MDSKELRQKFLKFFEKRGHKIVPSSLLIPKDETALLTSAGMQQFIPYLSSEKDVLKDFKTRHLCSIQKCFRTPDIEEVGDDTHNTFFEMMGNWSIGEDSKKGYFKKGAIEMALDFFVNEISLDKDKFWVTIFKGDKNIPKDKESLEIWRENKIPNERIVEFGLQDNFWGPVGETGPCGPCSEIHYDRGIEYGCKDPKCGPNCKKCNRFVELWNLVFMEYNKNKDKSYSKLPQKNVDTGIGFERLLSVLENQDSVYETDVMNSIIKEIEKISFKNYKDNKKSFRIIADHIRGSVFLINDGVNPSNIERGYILRRIIRRMIRYGRILNLSSGFLLILAKKVIREYMEIYPELIGDQKKILNVIENEEKKFEATLEKGLKQSEKLLKSIIQSTEHSRNVTGEEAFNLYQNYGFPLELTQEIAEERGLTVEKKDFLKAQKKHQEISRAGAEKKFGGVGKEATYESIKLHTATHLLHQALRQVLGKEVKQMGSDINSRRLRFDFSYSKKLSTDELKQVEDIVNQKIKQDLEIKKEEMLFQKAVKSGALAFFKEKYPDKVSVYSIGDFSKEICAGPHIKRTSELGYFKIIKQESSGAGIRR
ncbi:MAG: alanine--tRNA ligase, partial [Patescibacteria group bacterium]|nr:alanine--tRNA ligase [Patescibacteria group bacterium]